MTKKEIIQKLDAICDEKCDDERLVDLLVDVIHLINTEEWAAGIVERLSLGVYTSKEPTIIEATKMIKDRFGV